MAKAPVPIMTSCEKDGVVTFQSGKREYIFGIDFAIVEAAHKLYAHKPGKFFNIIRNRSRWMERRELL